MIGQATPPPNTHTFTLSIICAKYAKVYDSYYLLQVDEQAKAK